MFKEFKVEFQDVEMIGGADNLLENTKVTKVVMSGDNKTSSLDSTFKNCSELDSIQGGLDLNGVSDIDNILEGNSLIKSIDLKNINNENISANNSFPNIEKINIGGELYNKKAIQNVIASKEWTFENFNYTEIVKNNLFVRSVSAVDEDKVNIEDTLEQKAKSIEIKGKTYQNLINGRDEVDLSDELVMESINGIPNKFATQLEIPVHIEVIEGETLQKEGVNYSIGELQEDGTYKIDILSNDGSFYVYNNGKKDSDFIFENGAKEQNNMLVLSHSINIKIKTDKKYTINKNSKVLVKIVNVDFGQNGGYEFRFYLNNNVVKMVHMGEIYSSITSKGYYMFEYENLTDNVIVSELEFGSYFGGYYITEITICEANSSARQSTQSILLPQPLNKIGNVADKLYWDEDKGHYCIDQNIGDELEVMALPKIIDLTHLNKKYSLDTYMPTTYLECSNSPIQPSRLLLQSDTLKYESNNLKTSTDYTIQFKCKEKGNKPIRFSLGGAEKEVDAVLGVNHINITTPNELSDSKLELSGAGNKVADVMLIEGDMKQYPNYFDGIKSVGALQDDNTYRIDIKTNEDFIISIKTDLPLTKDDRLYWNDTNKRYEIDRNGEIEIPIVEGDIIDLPRLYQRTNTVLTVGTDTIKPSEIKVEYKDLN